jgi:uncharacterized protein (DUF1330 family)
MPAYLIVDLDIHDQVGFQEYAKGAVPLIAKHGGKPLAAGGQFEVIHGKWQPHRLGIIEFRDRSAIQRISSGSGLCRVRCPPQTVLRGCLRGGRWHRFVNRRFSSQTIAIIHRRKRWTPLDFRFREPPSHHFDFGLPARAATAAKRLGRAADCGWRICATVYGPDICPIDETACLASNRAATLTPSP